MHSASVRVKTEVYFGLYLSYRDYGGSNEGRKKDEHSLSLILDGCVVGCCWCESCVRLNYDERNVSSSDHVLVCMPALLYTHTHRPTEFRVFGSRFWFEVNLLRKCVYGPFCMCSICKRATVNQSKSVWIKAAAKFIKGKKEHLNQNIFSACVGDSSNSESDETFLFCFDSVQS